MSLSISKVMAVVLTVVVSCQTTVIEPPQDTTVSTGSDVTLTCQVSGNNNFMWLEYITSIIGKSIFTVPSDTQPESPHYAIEGTYNLVVKEVLATDGGVYGCDSVAPDSQIQSANLVVVDIPVLYIPDLVADKETSVHCDCDFGGPRPEDLVEGHVPSLRVYIDGDLQSGYAPVLIPGQPGNGDDYEVSTLKLEFNYTGSITDNGRNITCEAFTTNPQFIRSMSQLMDVRYPVQNIETAPEKPSFYVTETINCTAEGNPSPTFRWVPKSSNGAAIVNGPILTILENMLGDNEWECQAQNNVELVETITKVIEFEVLDGAPPGSDSTRLVCCRILPIATPLLVFLIYS